MPTAIETKFGNFIDGQELPTQWRSNVAKSIPRVTNLPGISVTVKHVRDWGIEVEVDVGPIFTVFIPWHQIVAVIQPGAMP